jgi:hypothetical protein
MPSPLDRFLGDSADEVDLDAREAEASENLRALVSPEPYGIDDCDVTDVLEVNEGPEGEPIVVPVTRYSLGRAKESPDLDLVWDLAYDAVRAMYPALEDVFVRHYDVQFAFGGGGLFDSESCRRMAVTREIATRAVTEAGWHVSDFEDAMLDGHDIDDVIAPVAWGECEDYDQGPYGGGGAGAAAGGGF